MATTLPPQTISLILDELPHASILRAAAISRHWRAAGTAHARFFRYLSLVHGEHSPVTLSADPRVLRFFAQLKNAAADERTPLAVRVEIWAADSWAPADYACIGDMVLPALRTAMPRIVHLDVRLPRRHAGETFAAAPRMRGLVLGLTGRAPPVPVPTEVFDGKAPRLRAVRLQGMHASGAARTRAFAKVRETRHDPPAPEDRALSTLQLIDIERGPRADAPPRRPAAEGFVPLAPAIAARMYRVGQLDVRYSAGDDVTPFLIPGGGLHTLRIAAAGSPAGMSVHLRAYARPECKVTLTPGKAGDAAEMLEAIAAALPRATVRALEVGAAFAPQFFAAFGGCSFAHAHTIKIMHTRQPDAAAVLAALLRLLPARAVACGVQCPVLRSLDIEWARDDQKRRLVLSRDQALLLAGGGGTDCRRVFDDMFDCTIEP